MQTEIIYGFYLLLLSFIGLVIVALRNSNNHKNTIQHKSATIQKNIDELDLGC